MVLSTRESFRDLVAGSLSVVTQSFGVAISAINLVASIFKKKTNIHIYSRILITGASDGIGKAIAEEFAKKTICDFCLVGRNSEKLDEIARICTAKGSSVKTIALDFSKDSDLQSLEEFIITENNRNPFDIIIANAGMIVQTFQLESPEITDKFFYDSMVNVNIRGILSTVMPVLDDMKTRKKGHIVLVSSINGYLGSPNQLLYSATKSFISSFGQDLHYMLRKDNVHVSIVMPGIINTNMSKTFFDKSENNENAAKFPKNLAQDPNKFANKIIQGIQRQDKVITFPYYQFLAAYVGGTLPPSVRYISSCIYHKSKIVSPKET